MKMIVFQKLAVVEAVGMMEKIEKWFACNSRQLCKTDLFRVRRGHVVEDILKHTDRDKLA